MPDCIFCKIIKGEIKSDILYRDDKALAFRDINPKAPVHILVIPIEHIPSVLDLTDKNAPVVGHLVTVANRLARQEGIVRSGYRLVINHGPDSGQVVQHLHMHLLGGRRLGDIA